MKKTVSFRATAEPFGSPDGVTKEFQLEYQGKDLIQPIDLAVTAMHQTDWQGRQLLYTTPRTNNIAPSDAFGGPLPNTTTGLSVVQSSTKVGGTGPNYVAFTRTDTGSSRSYIACTMSCVVGDVFTYRVWLRSDPTNGNGATAVGIYCASWGQPGCSTCSVLVGGGLVTVVNSYGGGALWTINGIPSNTDILVEVTRTIVSADGPSAKAFAYFGGVPTVTPGVVMLGAAPSFSKNQPAGAYIPTTTAPVTVTDYTVDTSGNVTFGQAPAKKASLDWDGSATADFVDASDTFLAQYATSPILTSLIQAANAAIDPRADFDAFMANVWDVYTAQGFGLDIWGRIVNIPRTINIPASNEFLGFDEALPDAEPFNQAPFYNGPQAGTLYTLSDDAYRVLILTKALANISSFTAQSMNALLNFMFNGQGTTRGSCYVLENATPMQITYVFNFALQSWEAAVLQQASLMPRPAGVGLTITVNP